MCLLQRSLPSHRSCSSNSAIAIQLEGSPPDVLAYMTFPAAHHRKRHSTNPLERPNKEVKRRTHVVGIFPVASSAIRLIGAVLREQNDEWQLQTRYLSQSSLTDTPDSTAPPGALALSA